MIDIYKITRFSESKKPSLDILREEDLCYMFSIHEEEYQILYNYFSDFSCRYNLSLSEYSSEILDRANCKNLTYFLQNTFDKKNANLILYKYFVLFQAILDDDECKYILWAGD